jgi:hypothetical protein
MAPFDNPEFWNPKNRSPICYNPPAVRSVLPLTIKRTELTGKTIAQIQEWEKAAYAKKDLPTILEPGAMSYMMSKEAHRFPRPYGKVVGWNTRANAEMIQAAQSAFGAVVVVSSPAISSRPLSR